ncbi:MAG: MYG1 family protein [Patescibacteria group bacterium]
MNKTVVIVTHDDRFHADDAFAVATLFCLLDKSPVQTTVVRTRDEALISKADFVVDVGAVHDPEKNRFDHHQIGGAGKRDNGIPYASFGLVWQKFGKDIAESSDAAMIVDRTLVTSIDASDSGVDIYTKIFPDTLPYTISDHIHNLRPTWQESAKLVDERFLEAVAFARKVLEREIVHAKASIAAESIVRKVYENTTDKRIIIFETFYDHEGTLASLPGPLFSVFPRTGGTWVLKAIREDMSLFKNRKDLPKEWAGLRDSKLAEITGVPDAIFCHNARFMAVAKSKVGAIALANLALNS